MSDLPSTPPVPAREEQNPGAGIPWIVPGDFDGFFALFIDNLLLLMLIALLCPTVCGLPTSLVFGRMLPGAALSICAGNVFYGWQARRLAQRTGRRDVTALPYGLNTVSVISFCFFIMGPVYAQTKNVDLTWKVGVFACFLSGVIETAGAFCADWLRRNTPRAALLCPLAGLSITFLAGSFTAQVFTLPLVGMIPLLLVLLAYGARLKLPGRVPAGLVAIVVGVLFTAVFRRLGWLAAATGPASASLGWTPPRPVNLFEFIFQNDGWRYFAVILPIGILGILSAIQILDSAEAAGDRYPTRSSLLMNGVGTLAASLFGSPFTTALYIGHPAWKGLGARSAYSTLNGVVIMLLCLFGGVPLVMRLLPVEAALGILVWIGIVMTAQAFRDSPRTHGPAVAFGLIPALAAWALPMIRTAVEKAGGTLYETAPKFGGELYLHGLIALSQGSLISSMVLGALMAHVMDRRYRHAAAWALAASGLSFVGLIHAYVLTPAGIVNRFGWAAAPEFATGYLACAVALLGCAFMESRGWLGEGAAHD